MQKYKYKIDSKIRLHGELERHFVTCFVYAWGD